MVSPSAAVTITVNSFSPLTRSVPPVTSKVASASSVSTATSTEVAPAATSNVSPSTTSEPLIVNDEMFALLLAGTFKVTK